jgi:hypothetical protein
LAEEKVNKDPAVIVRFESLIWRNVVDRDSYFKGKEKARTRRDKRWKDRSK